VLIDGEHYPPVVRAALATLRGRCDVVGGGFVGGQETMRGGEAAAQDLAAEYGLPVLRPVDLGALWPDAGRRVPAGAVERALAPFRALLSETRADLVVDLSDEPVLGYRERFVLISAALAGGVGYQGADFVFGPQSLVRVTSKPSLAIIGTGKRVGKTAVAGFVVRLLEERHGPGYAAVLAMGRGGPQEPELVGGPLDPAALLALSRSGRHAASDCYEDAVLAGVTTVGCRRCGGGMAGASFESNVREALALVESLPAQLVVFEGSGSVMAPVCADATLCVAAASQPPDYITGYLGTYRLLLADLVVLTMCEPPFAGPRRVRELIAGVRRTRRDLPVVKTVFRPRPAQPVRGRKVAYFTTASERALAPLVAHLRDEHGADVVTATSDLARRPALAQAVAAAARDADVFLTEIKAAAIDVVAEAADRYGKELVFCDNVPVGVDGDDLEAAAESLAELCRRRFGEG
jgi:cyclic 2,3-diphosphoglycerate synthetase